MFGSRESILIMRTVADKGRVSRTAVVCLFASVD